MHKHFAAARREASGEAITFEIEARDGSVSEPFTLEPDLAAMPLLDLASMGEQRPDANQMEAVIAFRNFLRAIIVPGDVARFEQTVRDFRLSFDDLLPIVQWAVEQMVGRPTQQPSPSPEPRLSNGATSRQDLSELVTTPGPSFT